MFGGDVDWVEMFITCNYLGCIKLMVNRKKDSQKIACSCEIVRS